MVAVYQFQKFYEIDTEVQLPARWPLNGGGGETCVVRRNSTAEKKNEDERRGTHEGSVRSMRTNGNDYKLPVRFLARFRLSHSAPRKKKGENKKNNVIGPSVSTVVRLFSTALIENHIARRTNTRGAGGG